MAKGDIRDIIGGGALIGLGAFSVWYSPTFLKMGTLNHMGPGMFPFGVGIVLAGLGVAILLPALIRERQRIRLNIMAFATIMVSILAFALLLRPFGLVPAIFGLTLTSSLAEWKLSLVGQLLLAAVLSVGATAIFKFGFGLPVPIFTFPW